jgi:hypothetical protein
MFILPHLKALTTGNLGSAVFKNADLDLKFADNKSLVDSVTGNSLISFSRASGGTSGGSGTYVDSNGVLQSAVTNLLLQSEAFGTTWTLVAGTLSTDSAASPTGTTTADKLIATNGGPTGQLSQGLTITSGATVTGSVYVKAGGFDRLEIVLLASGNITPYGRATFNPNTGAITTAASTANGGTSASAFVVDAGNGWYRCIITVTYPAVTSAGIRFTIFNSDNANGDGVKGSFLWGAQLEQSSTVGEYVPTTSAINSAPRFDHRITSSTTNLLLWSQVIRLGEWANQQASTQAINQTTAPDGTTTATTLTENTQSANRFISQTIAVTNAAHTFSVFVKIKERKRIMLRESSVSGAAVTFDASTATVIGAESGATGAISSVGNDWYRCSMTHTPSTVSSRSYAIYLMPDTGTSFATSSYTGDNTSGIYLWGAQLEQSSTVGPYVPTTTAAATSNSTESLGLLVEEARTNSIRNNTMVGAVAGTPGTLPTNWITSLNGLTRTVVGSGTVNGISYLDIRFNGTTSGSGQTEVKFDGNASITGVSAGQVWTQTAWVAVVNGSTANISGSKLTINEYSAGPTYLRTATNAFNILAGGSTFTRVGGASTNGALTTILEPVLTVECTSAVAIDITLRIGLPQLEQGAFATSVVLTNNTAAGGVTRAADVANITGSNFGVTRTNLLQRSEEFDNTFWTKVNGTIVVDNVASPTDAVTADKLVETSSTGFHRVFNNTTAIAASTAYTLSVYAKASERSNLVVELRDSTSTISAATFNLTNGTFVSTTGTNHTITALPNGWYRLAVSATTSALHTFNGSYLFAMTDGTSPTYTGDGTSGLFLWGAQLETGSAATPYIPTTTAAVSVFESSWYNQTEGTVFYEGTVSQGLTSFPWFYNISDGTVNNSIGVYQFTNGIYGSVVASGTAATPDPAVLFTPVSGAPAKHALAVKASDTRAAYNATLSSAQTNTVMPVVNQLAIGQRVTGSRTTGTIKRLTYWPTRLANTTLQQITQP